MIQRKLEAILPKAWDEWVQETDRGQENAARLLHRVIDDARKHKISEIVMFRILQPLRNEVNFASFIDMLNFLDDWEGCH